ncbi:lactonase family protein [Paludibacter sp.]|uniref:lactonase family protein n=1 Tax=Paludibacter sp. TaxID=1898105 RepID=UPI001355F53E|nr:lactonase family protein [Paludibacter sp.]MTK54229.1 lactonase family protein [Paludibacter sp.]
MIKHTVSLLLLCASFALVSAQKNNSLPFFIGTYTGEGSEGVYRCWLDTVSGKLSTPELAARVDNPSYLAVSADNRFLWTVGEMNKTYCLSAFSIDKSMSLNFINSQSGEGSYSCYIAELEAGKWLGAASYGSGLVTFYPLNSDGSIGALATVDKHWGKVTRAHCILPDPKEKYIYSADLGLDKILIYTVEDGKLSPFAEVNLPKGMGPRHIDFDASGKWMAVANELASKVTIIKRDSAQTFTNVVSHTTMLPSGFTTKTSAADIHFSPDGRFLYASNRGHNSIVVYAFDNTSGALKTLGWATQGINRPRNFVIDPTGKFLLVANQDGNDIVVFRRNQRTGMLSPVNEKVSVSHPVCIKFIRIKH